MNRSATLQSGAQRRAGATGFTLIEVMIVVAIVTILIAIALPSYRGQVRKSTRAEAQAYMMAVATRQQQFLVDTRAYATTLAAVGVDVPANVSSGYELTMPTPGTNPPSFTLTLKAKASQSGEKCGDLSISHTGKKTAATTGCW